MLDRIRKWEPDSDEALRKLYADGVRLADIAAEINQRFGTAFTEPAVQTRAVRMRLRRDRRPGEVWTPERKAELKALVERGMSYGAVAKIMGRTRSSISGQVTKQALGRTEKEALLHRSMKRALKDQRDEGAHYAKRMGQLLNWTPHKYRQDGPLPPFCEPVDDPLNLSMAEVGHKQCRWITNEDLSDARYCGHPTTRKSWCARHAAVVLA